MLATLLSERRTRLLDEWTTAIETQLASALSVECQSIESLQRLIVRRDLDILQERLRSYLYRAFENACNESTSSVAEAKAALTANVTAEICPPTVPLLPPGWATTITHEPSFPGDLKMLRPSFCKAVMMAQYVVFRPVSGNDADARLLYRKRWRQNLAAFLREGIETISLCLLRSEAIPVWLAAAQFSGVPDSEVCALGRILRMFQQLPPSTDTFHLVTLMMDAALSENPWGRQSAGDVADLDAYEMHRLPAVSVAAFLQCLLSSPAWNGLAPCALRHAVEFAIDTHQRYQSDPNLLQMMFPNEPLVLVPHGRIRTTAPMQLFDRLLSRPFHWGCYCPDSDSGRDHSHQRALFRGRHANGPPNPPWSDSGRDHWRRAGRQDIIAQVIPAVENLDDDICPARDGSPEDWFQLLALITETHELDDTDDNDDDAGAHRPLVSRVQSALSHTPRSRPRAQTRRSPQTMWGLSLTSWPTWRQQPRLFHRMCQVFGAPKPPYLQEGLLRPVPEDAALWYSMAITSTGRPEEMLSRCRFGCARRPQMPPRTAPKSYTCLQCVAFNNGWREAQNAFECAIVSVAQFPRALASLVWQYAVFDRRLFAPVLLPI
jgi:hypothetical protein